MTSSVAAPQERAATKPIWEDMIDIFYAPAAVFSRRGDGRYAVQALVLTVIFVLMALSARSVLAPVYEAEFARGMAQAQAANPELNAEQFEGMRKFGEIMVIIGAAFFIPITAIAVGAATRLFGAIFGAALSFKVAVMVVVYAQFPRALQQLLYVVQGFVLPPESLDSRFAISFSPARFLDVDATSAVLMALAERFDIFTLWATVIIAVGLHVLGKLPRGQAYLVATLVWLCGAIPALLGALRAG